MKLSKETKEKILSALITGYCYTASAQVCLISAINTRNSKDPENFFTEIDTVKIFIMLLSLLSVRFFAREWCDEVRNLFGLENVDHHSNELGIHYESLEDGENNISKNTTPSLWETLFTCGFSPSYPDENSKEIAENTLPKKIAAISFITAGVAILLYIAWHQAKLVSDAFHTENIILCLLLLSLTTSVTALGGRHLYKIMTNTESEFMGDITHGAKPEKFSIQRAAFLMVLLLVTHIPSVVLQNENVIKNPYVLGIPSHVIEYLGMTYSGLFESSDHQNHCKPVRSTIQKYLQTSHDAKIYTLVKGIIEASIPASSDGILFLINVLSRPFSVPKKIFFISLSVFCAITEGALEFAAHYLAHVGLEIAQNYPPNTPWYSQWSCRLFGTKNDTFDDHSEDELSMPMGLMPNGNTLLNP